MPEVLIFLIYFFFSIATLEMVKILIYNLFIKA